MDIKKYEGYFHDGGIIDVKHINNSINIHMESAEIDPDDIEGYIILSKSSRLTGILHIESINKITINNRKCDEFKLVFDSYEILEFEINDSNVFLLLIGTNYPPKTRMNQSIKIEIAAGNIYWENIPDLYDPMSE